MAECCICHAQIPRGKKYKSNHYKNNNFCSEECYNIFLKQKEKNKDPYISLTDYIDRIYPPDTVNWGMITKQIKQIRDDYELDYKTILLVLRYAVEFANHEVDERYTLGQFFPRYIEPTLQFIDKIKENKNVELPEEEIYVVKKPSKKRRNVKIEEW